MAQTSATFDAMGEQLAALIPMVQAMSDRLGAGEHLTQEAEMQNDGEVTGGSADNFSTIAERDAAKRLVAQRKKEQSMRHFALSLTMPTLTGDGGKARLQTLVEDDLAVTGNVFRILNTLSSMRVDNFGPHQIKVARGKGR